MGDLRDIREGIEGVIPPLLCTADAHGMPHVIHVSLAVVLDAKRLGVSRQFQKKTVANLERDPRATLFVTRQRDYQPWTLSLRWVGVETQGRDFDAMKVRIDAIAAMSGMKDVFALRGLDVFELVGLRSLEGLNQP